jgi:multidrug efflux pump
MTGTGLMALAGVVVNHNIVLIDTFHRHIKAGMDPIEAVIRSSAQRLRPVFLTTVTAIGGLLPMMFAVEINFWHRTVEVGSANASMWVQLSTAVIFGLAFSKVITLGLVPAMLALPYRVRERHGSFVAMFAAMPSRFGRAMLWLWRILRRLLGLAPQADAMPAE